MELMTDQKMDRVEGCGLVMIVPKNFFIIGFTTHFITLNTLFLSNTSFQDLLHLLQTAL